MQLQPYGTPEPAGIASTVRGLARVLAISLVQGIGAGIGVTLTVIVMRWMTGW